MEELNGLLIDLGKKLTISKNKTQALRNRYTADNEIIALDFSLDRALEVTAQVTEYINNNSDKIDSASLSRETFLTVEMLKRLAKMYDLKVAIDVDHIDSLMLAIDHNKMMSIADNIFENAVKAKASIIKITGRSTGNLMSIRFADNGQGSKEAHEIKSGIVAGYAGFHKINKYIKDAGGSASCMPNSFGGVSVTITLNKR